MKKPLDAVFARDLSDQEDQAVLQALAASPQAALDLAREAEKAYKATGSPHPLTGLPWKKRLGHSLWRLAWAGTGVLGLGLAFAAWYGLRDQAPAILVPDAIDRGPWHVVRQPDPVLNLPSSVPPKPASRPSVMPAVPSKAPASAEAPPARVQPRATSLPRSYNRLAAVIRLASPALVEARVLDAQGRLLRSLASRTYAAGTHRIEWDGKLADGSMAEPGDYVLEVSAQGKTMKKPVRLLKP